MSTLREKISNRTAHIAVIGIGYVGLPLATALAQAQFRVTVVDIDGGYLCAHHAIETMITVDLRAEEPIVTVSVG